MLKGMPEIQDDVRRRRLRLRRHGAEPGHLVRQPEGLRRAARARSSRRRRSSGQLFGAFSQITGAMVIPFLPPSINGLGQFGGFTYELLDQSGGPIEDLAAAAQQLIAQGNQTPGLTGALHAVHGQRSAARGEHRSRAGEEPRACRSATSPARCRCCSARPTSTTSTSTTGRIASTCRRTSSSASKPADIERYYVRTAAGRMMPLSNIVVGRRDDGAEDDQPLQPVPVGGDQRLGRAGLQLGPGAADDGGAVEPGAAAGHDVLVVGRCRSRRSRPARSRASSSALGLLLVYLTLAGAVREPDAAVHHPAVGAARDPRRAARAVGPRADQRRLLPDRAGDADRPVGEERHSHRRVRRAAARARDERSPKRRSRPRASGCGRF